jgi:hypothetical protein
MRISALPFFVLFWTVNVSAQEIISTQGDSYANSNGSIDFTIGEVITETVSDGTYDMTQGFHQTNWNFAGIVDHKPTFQALIYPNPTSAYLNIQASDFNNVEFKLFDAQGKIVKAGRLETSETLVHVKELAPGNYSLVLFQTQNFLKTFKLTKLQ